MKNYWVLISFLNKITPKLSFLYFRFNDGLQDKFHFGFHFIVWHFCGRVHISKNHYTNKFTINKTIHWLG